MLTQKILIAAFLLASSVNLYSQSRIIVDISGARNDKGVCRACLFNSADAYENKKPLQCKQSVVVNGRSNIVFENVNAGNYAVFVFHDANNNSRMDKNFMGIPREGYGASKNSLPFASAPGYNSNKFTVSFNGTTRLSIKLRNL